MDTPSDLALKEQFLREAPVAWESYIRQAQDLQGIHSFKLLNPEGAAENHYEFKMSGRNKLYYLTKQRHMEGATDYHTFWVFAINPKYSFGLTRKTPSSPWVVAELTLDDPDPEASFQTNYSEMRPAMSVLVRLGNEPLMELIQKPGFRVIRCQQVTHLDWRIAGVHFAEDLAQQGNW